MSLEDTWATECGLCPREWLLVRFSRPRDQFTRGAFDLAPVASGTSFGAIAGALLHVAQPTALVALTLVGLLFHGRSITAEPKGTPWSFGVRRLGTSGVRRPPLRSPHHTSYGADQG
jgi:hypothetical protein